MESSKAKFIGIYKIINRTRIKYIKTPKDFPYQDFFEPEDFYYEMEELNILDDLKDRLVLSSNTERMEDRVC